MLLKQKGSYCFLLFKGNKTGYIYWYNLLDTLVIYWSSKT